MRIRLGFEMVFHAPAPVSMLLLLSTHPSRASSLVKPDLLRTDPELPQRQFLDAFGNRCTRILAPAGRLLLATDALVQDDGRPDHVSIPPC